MGKLEIVSVGSIHSRRLGCSCPDMATSSCVGQKYIAKQRSGASGRRQKAMGKMCF